MAMDDTQLTIIGNLTKDPELSKVGNDVVCNFTVASTPRTYDRNANAWKDGETLFMRCAVWRDQAEHLAASCGRGDRVMVRGRLKANHYNHKETGENRMSMQMDVDELGVSLRFATAQVTKVRQNDNGGNGNFNRGNNGHPLQDDNGWGAGGGNASDDAPF